jgi:hypothetical protein
MNGARMKNWAATSTCARRSACSEQSRDAEKRQAITALATPSMALAGPKAISAIEAAISPATSATAPSMPSQTRLARRAAASAGGSQPVLAAPKRGAGGAGRFH